MKVVDDEIRRLIDDMAETMYAAPSAVGLAATQVGVMLRVFVIDIAGEDEPSDLRTFINPEVTDATGTLTWEEGCLSVPWSDGRDPRRAEHVHVRALDRDGKPFELNAEGLPRRRHPARNRSPERRRDARQAERREAPPW